MGIWESDGERSERHTWWEQAKSQPVLAAGLNEMHHAILRGELTLAQAGGITPEQLDAAYAGACKLVGIGKIDEAQQIAGYLILIDPYRARSYALAGTCFHHKRRYALALAYYDVALALGEDAVTRVAQGEALLMLGRRDDARRALEQGIAAAPPTKNVQPFVQRAQHLLSTYLSRGEA
ncbi:MAG: hypothetical protein HYZ27_00855 [Deltaproteobacteria bacterium]|nr:hypothetical protein [Deltaproteobacteria bacterium]